MTKKLNIACGSRYHKDWINIDFHAGSKDVKQVNILSGLPFEDNTIDVIYSSHFIEHLSISQANYVLKESIRIMKPKGVLRIVVPDLENVCREYLDILGKVLVNDKIHYKYEWITIELLDQLVRTNTGGDMLKKFNQVTNTKNIELAKYIQERTGIDLFYEKSPMINRTITLDRVKNKLLYMYLKIIRLLIPKDLRDLVFVSTSIGEKHRSMYDRYSIRKILEDIGFRNISIRTYNTSHIDNFNEYALDVNQDGTPYQGMNSLYVEALK